MTGFEEGVNNLLHECSCLLRETCGMSWSRQGGGAENVHEKVWPKDLFYENLPQGPEVLLQLGAPA